MGWSLGAHLNPKWSMRMCRSYSHLHKPHWQVLSREEGGAAGRALGNCFNELLMEIIPYCTIAIWEKQWGTNPNCIRMALKERGNPWELSTVKTKRCIQNATGLGTKCRIKTLMYMNDCKNYYSEMLWYSIQIIHFVCLFLAPNPFSHSDLSFCL